MSFINSYRFLLAKSATINFYCADDDEDGVHHDDAVVGRSTLIDLCNEAAKLKSMGCMNQVCLLVSIMFFALFVRFEMM